MVKCKRKQHRRALWRFLVSLLLTSLPLSLRAEVPLKFYREYKDEQQLRNYLVGVGRGIFWTNVFLDARGLPPLFCVPKSLALDAGIVLSVIDQEIRKPTTAKGEYSDDDDVEHIAVRAFVNKFPCE